MALRRLSEKLETSFISNPKFDKDSDITIRSNLIEINICKTENTQEQIKKIYEVTNGDLRKMITQLQYNSIPGNKFLPFLLEFKDKPEIVLQKLLKENIQPDYILIEIYNYAIENNHLELLQQLSNVDGNIQYGGQPVIQLMTILKFI